MNASAIRGPQLTHSRQKFLNRVGDSLGTYWGCNEGALHTDLRFGRPEPDLCSQKKPGQSATTLECWLFW
jgi:hypothetical protein